MFPNEEEIYTQLKLFLDPRRNPERASPDDRPTFLVLGLYQGDSHVNTVIGVIDPEIVDGRSYNARDDSLNVAQASCLSGADKLGEAMKEHIDEIIKYRLLSRVMGEEVMEDIKEIAQDCDSKEEFEERVLPRLKATLGIPDNS